MSSPDERVEDQRPKTAYEKSDWPSRAIAILLGILRHS